MLLVAIIIFILGFGSQMALYNYISGGDPVAFQRELFTVFAVTMFIITSSAISFLAYAAISLII